MFSRRVYLDAAASVPVRREAARAYARAAHAYANPSSPHEEGRRAKEILEDARRTIARLAQVKADDVVFTSGATEANALALLGLPKSGEHVLYLPSAHSSIVENVRLLAARGVQIEALPLKEGGSVDSAALRKMIRPETVLVSMEAVCGETGTVWNTREVAHVLKQANPSAYLHVDASQAPLAERFERAHFGADLISLDASKVGGVRGIGCLIAHRTIPLRALYAGGGQERGLRSGTENPALAAAFAAALAACGSEREKFRAHASLLRADFKECVGTVPGLMWNESRETVPHIINLSLPERDTDYIVALLDEAGIAVSTKSACETDSQTGSRAVFALFGDEKRAQATLRLSFLPGVKERELRRSARELSRAVAFVDKHATR